METHKIENFREVDKHVFRSARPNTKAHIDFLKSEGFSGIISLERMLPGMLERANEHKIEVLNMPWDEEEPPEKEEIERAMKFIDKHAERRGKVLVHCLSGKQRSGTLSALYRIYRGEHPLLAYGKEDYGISQRHKESILKYGEEKKNGR